MAKTWLITGAGRGMGVEFARAALTAGHNVVATGRNADNRRIQAGKVFDLELPLEEAAAGYRAMDQRGAIKVLLRP